MSSQLCLDFVFSTQEDPGLRILSLPYANWVMLGSSFTSLSQSVLICKTCKEIYSECHTQGDGDGDDGDDGDDDDDDSQTALVFTTSKALPKCIIYSNTLYIG